MHELINYSRVEARFPDEDEEIVDKKILVLGDDTRFYSGNRLATPFLNWQLADKVFSGLNYYRRIEQAHVSMINDLPDVIVDLEGKVPLLFERLPLVARNYEQSATEARYYLRR